MEADKHEWKVLHEALNEWEQTGLLSSEKTAELKQSIVSKYSDRHQIAQYFFFIALFCILMAFGAIFINEKLLERIKTYFAWNDLIIAVLAAALSGVWLWYVSRKRAATSFIAYEMYMVLGGLMALTSLVYFCKEFPIDKTHTAFLSMALPLLVVLAPVCRSRALWIGAVITTVAWFGSFSTWLSTDNLFLGMNYPVRFAVLGLVILGISYAQTRIKYVAYTYRITYAAGLILFFAALWAVSIFGNYNTLVGWQQVRQIHVLAYSIIFGIAAAISFYLGVRYKDELARDLGVLFLLINLYTRYFEYFWDAMNKGIFFLILAITFGLLGWWLERKRKQPATETTKES